MIYECAMMIEKAGDFIYVHTLDWCTSPFSQVCPRPEFDKQLFLEQQFMHGARYDGKKPFLSPLHERFFLVERTLPIVVTDPDIHNLQYKSAPLSLVLAIVLFSPK